LAGLVLTAGWWILFWDSSSANQSIDSALESASLPETANDETASERQRIERSGRAESVRNPIPAIRVVVRAEGTGLPLDRIRVILEGSGHSLESTTDRGGRVLFESLSAGSYTVRAIGDGFQDGKAVVELTPGGNEREILIDLEPGTLLEGTVLCISSRQPVAGVQVRYHEPVTGTDRRAESSEKGQFRFGGLPAGQTPERNHLRWGKSRYFSMTNGPEIVVAPAGSDRFETILYLEPGLNVSGRVLDSKGRGAPNATVFAYHVESQATKSFRFYQDFGKTLLIDGMEIFEACSTRTDDEGFFRIPAVPTGVEITIAACVPGHCRTESGPIVLQRGDRLSGIVLRAISAAFVSGRVSGENDSPIKGVFVDLYGCQKKTVFSFGETAGSKPVFLDMQRTDSSGSFSFEELEPGEYRLRAYKQGYGNCLSEWFTLKRGATVAKSFLLEKGALWASGRVVDIEGKPVPGIVVEFTPWPLPRDKTITPFNTVSKRDGSFHISGLWNGARHMVRARDREHRRVVERVDDLPRLILPDTKGIEFRAYRAGKISGRIENIPAGAVARVELLSESDAGRRVSGNSHTEKGRFTIEKIMPGLHSVQVKGKGLAEKTVGQVVVAEGECLEGLVFFYGETIELSGIVRADQSRSPLGKIRVTLIDRTLQVEDNREDPGSPIIFETITDASGRFCFRGLGQARYDLIAWDLIEGSGRIRNLNLLHGDNRKDVEVILSRGVTVNGTAYNGMFDEPARSAPIRVVSADQVVRTLMTDRDGVFDAILPPGPYVFAMELPSGQYGTCELDVPAAGISGLELRFEYL